MQGTLDIGGSQDYRDPSHGFLNANLGFVCVVIAPSIFWAVVCFAALLAVNVSAAPELALSVFAFCAAFLSFVATSLKLRI